MHHLRQTVPASRSDVKSVPRVYRVRIVSQADPDGGVIVCRKDEPNTFIPDDQIVDEAILLYFNAL